MNQMPAWRHPGFAWVISLVEERAGLMPPTCPPAAEEGIARAMARAGFAEHDFGAYVRRLSSDEAALDDLLTELTIGETYFFRTPEHFDFVHRVVLPELRQRKGPRHEVRAWSAGCASGEEPYSLAVLLREDGWAGHMHVLGTDVSRAALARASAARYGPWSLRGPEAERMRPFLLPDGRRFVLTPEVRDSVRFEYLNLALDTWPDLASGIADFDVIFCRNVLIYFNRATVEAVARRLFASLSEGGYLLMGPSDPPLHGMLPLETLVSDWGTAYRRPVPGERRAAITHVTEPHRPHPAAAPHLPGATQPFTANAPPTPPLLPNTPPEPLLPANARPPPPSPRATPGEPSAPPAPAPPTESARPESLEDARHALAQGNWREAARLTGALEDDRDAVTRGVRALANLDPEVAARVASDATIRHPLSVELRYLQALLLLGLGRLADAERAARQALYLEPALAVAHLTLGFILRRTGDTAGALRAFGAAEAICSSLPPDTEVPLGDGEHAGRLAEVARGERARLEAAEEEGE
ncbi:protein-glutamate O-methyltransferase CheR [Myxococcaceae bacterium GXIMD 01537]